MGPPSERDSFLGALISHEHLEKVRGYVDLAVEEGGRILVGGTHVVEDLSDEHKSVSRKMSSVKSTAVRGCSTMSC